MPININHLYKDFKKKCALKDFSYKLDNHTYGLLGPNGSGKSTLVRILTGILKQTSGEINFLNGNDNHMNPEQFLIGYLPQKFGVLRELSVYEQMEYFACLKRIPKSEQEREIEHALEEVHLEDKKKDRCSSLSGGMIRRIGIAQAILGKPGLLLFDEPTVGLDPEERMRFKTILQRLQGKQPILLSTHIVEDVDNICDYVIVMNKGEILCSAAPLELAAKADGRVFEVPSAYMQNADKAFYLEKYIENGSFGKGARMLWVEKEMPPKEKIPADSKKVDTILEDGYMLLIKGEGR